MPARSIIDIILARSPVTKHDTAQRGMRGPASAVLVSGQWRGETRDGRLGLPGARRGRGEDSSCELLSNTHIHISSLELFRVLS